MCWASTRLCLPGWGATGEGLRRPDRKLPQGWRASGLAHQAVDSALRPFPFCSRTPGLSLTPPLPPLLCSTHSLSLTPPHPYTHTTTIHTHPHPPHTQTVPDPSPPLPHPHTHAHSHTTIQDPEELVRAAQPPSVSGSALKRRGKTCNTLTAHTQRGLRRSRLGLCLHGGRA